MALDSWMYGDPETVAIRKQEEAVRKERACGHCVHKCTQHLDGQPVHFCSFKRHTYGTRCDQYRIGAKRI